MLYIVQGYLFISIYNFILFKDRNNENKDFIILKSIVTSYILKVIYDFILNWWFKDHILSQMSYTVNLICLSVLSAYLLASIAKSKIFNKILLTIGIHRTTSDNIWQDIIPNGTFMRVYSKDGKKSYLGLCVNWEPDSREPIVYLKKYQILNEYGEVLVDNFNKKDRSIVLNLANFERVDLIQGEKEDKPQKSKS